MTRPVVLLTALDVEYRAVRERLAELNTELERGTRYEVGHLPETTIRVVLGLTGKGNHSSAVLTERAIRKFSPVAVLFVGVAGSLWDGMHRGDIIVATHAQTYHGATSERDGTHARPRSWETGHGLAQAAAHVARSADWAAGPSEAGAPQVHRGPIVSGEVVQNSQTSRDAEWIRHHFNDAMAIEMEAAGVAQAGHLSGVPVAIVRGVSDRADGTKTTSADRQWQPRAAANAAAFAVRLAAEIGNDQEDSVDHQDKGSVNRHGVHNHATGIVGIQSGSVTGSSVQIGTGSQSAGGTGLAAELAALRVAVERERSAGTLDGPTAEAAHVDIDVAEKALGAGPEGKGVLVTALKRLRGLVAEVAGLAVGVAALLTAANALP